MYEFECTHPVAGAVIDYAVASGYSTPAGLLNALIEIGCRLVDSPLQRVGGLELASYKPHPLANPSTVIMAGMAPGGLYILHAEWPQWVDRDCSIDVMDVEACFVPAGARGGQDVIVIDDASTAVFDDGSETFVDDDGVCVSVQADDVDRGWYDRSMKLLAAARIVLTFDAVEQHAANYIRAGAYVEGGLRGGRTPSLAQ